MDSRRGGNSTRRAWARRLVDVTVLVLAGWTAFGLAREARSIRSRQQWTQQRWQLGSRQTQELRRCLNRAVQALPREGPVLLYGANPHWDRWFWAAYSLPGRDVVTLETRPPAVSVIVMLSPDRLPRAKRIFGNRRCGVYRVR
jgi:hypothetical protein